MTTRFKNPLFNPSTEIPSLTNKTILITGGTNGLGRETVLSFAAHSPAHIYFTGRSQASADAVLTSAKTQNPSTSITFLKCDLASLASVRSAAQQFLERESRLDILNANAGIMAVPPGLTDDGYEIQFGTNHLGHALLVKLLTPIMTATAQAGHDVRVVWNTSVGHKGARGISFPTLKTKQEDISPILAPWMRYGQSKLANVLYARSYAKYNPSITSVSIHPGVSATNLVAGLSWGNRIFVYATSVWSMMPPEMCAWNQQWAATARLGKGKREVETGCYYEPVGVKPALSKWAGDEELAERLWRWTETELEGWKL